MTVAPLLKVAVAVMLHVSLLVVLTTVTAPVVVVPETVATLVSLLDQAQDATVKLVVPALNVAVTLPSAPKVSGLKVTVASPAEGAA